VQRISGHRTDHDGDASNRNELEERLHCFSPSELVLGWR
jgi:hypothetical protein